jgi:putative transposase
MKNTKSLYHGHRFPAAVISRAVRWYFRFQLSLRDIGELLFERGVIVSYETVRRWCDKFGACFAHRVKATRRKPGTTWHLDDVFVTWRCEPYLLWRAVDQHGAELDFLLQKRRDKAAAKRFFKRVLASCAEAPRKIVTDQLRSYPAQKLKFPNWPTPGTSSSKPARGSIAGPKTVISRRENVSDACVASAILSAHRLSYRDSVRSGSTSHSSDICYAPRSIENSSPHASPLGIVSLKPPKIRPLSEQVRVLSDNVSRTL